MALIGTDIQIIDIGNHVCIIRNPGTDSEEVLIRYSPSDRRATGETFNNVQHSVGFTRDEKSWIFFWMGYFYAHLGRK